MGLPLVLWNGEHLLGSQEQARLGGVCFLMNRLISALGFEGRSCGLGRGGGAV